MATQTQSKNQTITVTGLTLPNGNTNGKATISSSGPDAGYVINVQDSAGSYLSYSDAVTTSQNSTNAAKINSALSATNSSETLNGVIAPAAYSQNTQLTPTGTTQSTSNQTPASGFGIDPLTFSNTSGTNSTGKVYPFPVDMKYSGQGSQDHIRIRALKYKPPQGNGGFNDVVGSGLKSANANLPPPNYEYEGEVILPIPTQVRDRSSASWSMQKMSPVMAAGVGVVQPLVTAAGGNVAQAGMDVIEKFKNTPSMFAGQGADFREVFAASLSSALLGQVGLGGLEPSDILARTTGKVSNPNMELLFRGPNMREFEFSWKFVCRNSDDAKRIREIIKFLKIQCLPNILASSTNLIDSPNVFFIRYMNGDTRIKSLPQPKICALVEFGIDHTPDQMGWAAYEDSHPISTSLTMQFAELTPLFRNELEQAFPEGDDVGY